MTGNKVLVVAAITTALGILGTVPAAASDHNGNGRASGNVVPCSLAGVNPAHHPEIFGSPAAAKAYGFVQGPDRVWRVESNCRRY
jgi:hypothetical protein